MMVEAGGTEKAWQLLRGRRAEGHRGGHRRRPRGVQGVDQGVDRPAAPARRQVDRHARPDRADEYTPVARLRRRRVRRGRATSAPTSSPRPITIADKAERNAAIDAVKAEVARRAVRHRRGAGQFAGREREVKEAVRSLTKKLVRKRIVDEGVRIDGRGPADLRPLSAEVGVLPTAHGSGLFQRGETQVLNVATLGMPRMDQMLDTLAPDDAASATCTTTTCRRAPTARPAASVRRSAARSATARSPSGRCCRSCPSQEEFAYTLRLVSEVLASNGSTSMASVCALDAVADGRRRADQGAGRRHRHGPRLRRGQVHDPHRHPRCRGRVRRHGLQGRRHGRRSSPRCSSTPRSTASPPTCWPRRCEQAKDARLADPRGHERRHRRAPRRGRRRPRRRSSASRSRSTRSARSSGPRARSSTRSSRRPAPTSASTTTASVGTVTIGSVDGGAVEEAKAPDRAHPRPADGRASAQIYTGRVVNITKFGAFVNILPGRDGLVHISKLGRRQAHRPRRGRARRSATRSRSASTTSTTRARSASSPGRRRGPGGWRHERDSRVRSGPCPPGEQHRAVERQRQRSRRRWHRRRGQLRRQLRRRTRQRTRRPRPEERAPRRDHQWWP